MFSSFCKNEIVLYKKIAISLAILLLLFSGQSQFLAQTKTVAVQKFALSKTDDEFLEDLEKRSFRYFWEQTDANTGITLDRARSDGERYEAGAHHYNVGSIAATGFALTSYCVAADRNWITRQEARTRTLRTLRFFATRAFEKNGWFYHWMDIETGERRWNSEVSSMDTALLLGGVLSVRGCFADDREIVRLATKIYNRVDFQWMLNSDEYLLSHGWRPETGFLQSRWDSYSEDSILYILGVGSRAHPISWRSWYAWKRDWMEYDGYKYLAAVSPLFIHQYSQAWIDFRGRRERYKNFDVNYFENSVTASRAQRDFCKSLSKVFPASYNGAMWGISASDSEKGYIAWGAPPPEPALDGTIVPYAPAGSLMFAPDISLPALKEMKEKYGAKIYGRYGFTDAFNPNDGWIDSDVIGIDLGITILGVENLRTGNVWRWFMRNAEIKNSLNRAMIR
ncbi:MAG: glucoamylase family protein [Pyrinomonadaceae bacterium]